MTGMKRRRSGKRARDGSPTSSRKRVSPTLPTPLPQLPDTLPQLPGTLPQPQLPTPLPQLPDTLPQLPGTLPQPQLSDTLPQLPGSDTLPQLPDTLPISTGYYTSNFKEVEMIGKGSYGEVYSCDNLIDGHRYAVKKIKIYEDVYYNYEKYIREAKLLAMLDHPNIIRYYHTWLELGVPTKELNDFGKEIQREHHVVYIVMELCKMNLETMIERKKIGVHQALDYGRQLMDGVTHMHANHVLHRDIWPQNIFISYSGVLKIADFGLARHLGDETSIVSSRLGRVEYISPEVERGGQRIDYKSDLYSCGVVCLEMFCPGMNPYQVEERLRILKKYHRGKETALDPVLGFLDPLLRKDPKNRQEAVTMLDNFTKALKKANSEKAQSSTEVEESSVDISELKKVRKLWLKHRH